MNENVNSTQRQIQEQKTTVHGTTHAHWIGECVKYGFFLALVIIGILLFLWVFGGDNGHYTVLGVLFVGSVIALYFLYHAGSQQYWKTKQAEMHSRFHDVSPLLTIGNRETEGYIPYYIPPFPERVSRETVKDEPHQENDSMIVAENAGPILTISQQREKRICEYYDEGKTMNEIVAMMAHSSIFDAPSLHDVRKALGKTGKEKKE
jgi:hypothetical protein